LSQDEGGIMEALRQQAHELHNKLNLIQKEISDKEKEILELRTANAKLIELNLGKQRKPASLEIQRKAITKIDLEILELKLVEKSLNEKLTDNDSAIRQERLKSRLFQFNEISKSQLQDIETVRRSINALEKSLIQLENVSGKNGALYGLLHLLWDSPETKQFIDLQEVLRNWSVSNINLELPLNIETTLSEFNNRIFGMHNQLSAIHNNSRTIPSSRVQKTSGSITKVGTVQDIRNNMAAAEAMKNKKTMKHVGVKSTMKIKPRMMAPA